MNRHECITKKWNKTVKRNQRERIRNDQAQTILEQVAAETTISEKKAIEWTSAYSTTNECTHYAVLMDPTQGTIAWCLAYPEPLSIEDQTRL